MHIFHNFLLCTYLESPSIHWSIETLELRVGKMFRANNRRQKVLIDDLPTPPMRLPTYDVLIIWIANNGMELSWKIWLQSWWLLIYVDSGRCLIIRRYLYLWIIPIRMIDNRLFYLRFLPLSGWDGFIIIRFHASISTAFNTRNHTSLFATGNDFRYYCSMIRLVHYTILANNLLVRNSLIWCCNAFYKYFTYDLSVGSLTLIYLVIIRPGGFFAHV